jgi:hypothetical protein
MTNWYVPNIRSGIIEELKKEGLPLDLVTNDYINEKFVTALKNQGFKATTRDKMVASDIKKIRDSLK